MAGLATLADEFATSGASDIELDIAVDPEVAAALPVGHRVQILQMAREALSNAVRHAPPTASRIGLHDDGRSLDSASRTTAAASIPDVAPRVGSPRTRQSP